MKTLSHFQGGSPRCFTHAAFTLALLASFVCLPRAATAATQTWTGGGPNNWYAVASNWSGNAVPTNSNDAANFSGTGANTRNGLPETILIETNAANPIGGNNGLNGITLTASQTTSVTFQADSTFNAKAIRFGHASLASGTNTSITMDAGSGSLIFAGSGSSIAGVAGDGTYIKFNFGQLGYNTATTNVLLNNNAPGGSVLKFDTGVIFGIGGGAIRTIIFDGTGDIIFNGRLLFNQQSYTLIKRGSGMLALGGDASYTGDATVVGLTASAIVKTNRITLQQGTLNINNAGAFGTTGTFTISGGVIDNASGAPIALKTNPRIIMQADLNFGGSNDLALGAGQIDLSGPRQNIIVPAGRLGLAGNISGTAIGINKTGAGTLVLSGTNVAYTGTISVASGAVMTNGSLIHDTVDAAGGAVFGGSGTAGAVIIETGGTLQPGDRALLLSDPATLDSGMFSGTIGAAYSTLTIDKSASAAGPLVQFAPGAVMEIALGKNLTNTGVAVVNSAAAATPSIAFNNTAIKITDLAGGGAVFGDYVLFSTSGLFATDFSGLTLDTDGVTITAGLAVADLSVYNQPGIGYKLKKAGENITLRLFSQPIITCDDAWVAVQGWSFSKTIAIDGLINSSTATGLPAGLSYNSATYTISGIPTAAAGTYTVTITASNADTTATKVVTIDVGASVPAPVFTSAPIVTGPVAPFSYTVAAVNLPQSVTAVSGMAPWMTLAQDPGTGAWVISGTPTGPGTWTILLEAGNPTGTTQFTLTVIIADTTAAPVITSAASAVWVINYPMDYQITANNAPAFYGVTGTLPAGMTFNPLTGKITGTPTAPGISTATTYAVNSTGTGSSPLVIDVMASMPQPLITGSPTAPGFLNQAFSYTITATNFVNSITVTSALPPWMSYDAATATLSGICTGNAASWPVSGSAYPVVVRATNLVGAVTGTINVVIKQYYPAPAITNTGTITCYEGRSFTSQIDASPTTGIESYSATGLPPGLSVNVTSGAITGAPAPAGLYSITLGATTSGGTGTSTLTLNVVPVPPGPFINSPAAAAGATGQAFNYQITAETPATTYGAKGLPPGLTLDPATGLISGTPAAGGYYQVEISTTDETGTFIATVAMTFEPAASTLVTCAGALATPGFVDGSGADARFNQPNSAAISISGTIYVADYANNTIRAIGADGTVSSYVFAAKPAAMAIDSQGNIYYADQQTNTIKKILPLDKTVWTIASGLLNPGGIAIDASDNVYFTDSGHNVIKKISAATGAVTIVAGSGSAGSADGAAAAAQFNLPGGIACDKATGTLYVADTLNSTIRAVNPGTGVVRTIAGMAGADGFWDGAGSAARFDTPQGLAIDATGILYVADTGNSTIRACDPKTGFVGTLIGMPQQTGAVDGSGIAALLNLPEGIAVDTNGTGDIYVVDSGNSAIRALLFPPCIIRPLVSSTVRAGRSITLDGAAWGSPTPSYQWYKDGATMLTGTQGATASLLVINSAKASDAGVYQIVAFNASGTVSGTMQLVVDTTSVGSTVIIDGQGGGGGGGAPSLWFLTALAVLMLARRAFTRSAKR